LAVVLLALAILIIFALTPVVSSETPSEPQATQVIKIMGAASAYPSLEVLASAYGDRVKGTDVLFLPRSHTVGGIMGIREGLADIGIVSRGLLPEEGVDLRYREYARDVLAVATNPSVRNVTNLTSGQLKAIYSGAVHNWQQVGGPNEEIVLLDRTEDDFAKILLRQHYLGEALKVTPSAVTLELENELANALQDTPYSIGTISLGYSIIQTQSLPMNYLSIDGVAPTADNAADGKYPMVYSMGLISRVAPPAAAQSFIDYVLSDAGAVGLRRCGLIPSATKE
jgi:phosphate transport system substrate-binding protein